MARTRDVVRRTCHVAPSTGSAIGAQRSRYRLVGDVLDRVQRARVLMLATLIATVVLCVAACSGSDHLSRPPSSTGAISSTSSDPSARSSPSRPTASAAPSSSTQVDAALSAYKSFSAATFAVERHPDSSRVRAHLAGLSFDPARGKQLGYAVSLTSQGVAWRGSPPTPRATVLSINLDAKPWPTVVVSDCPTPAPSWQEYVVNTGATVPASTSGASPPFEITANVILYQGHWGVQSTSVDRSRTCSA